MATAPRKLIQITAVDGEAEVFPRMYALCADGTILGASIIPPSISPPVLEWFEIAQKFPPTDEHSNYKDNAVALELVGDLEVSGWPPGIKGSKGVSMLHRPTGVTVVVAHANSLKLNRDAAFAAMGAALGKLMG